MLNKEKLKLLDEEFLIEQINQAEDNVGFFSGKQKAEREKLTARAFLKICGVSYQEQEIKICKKEEETPDILFREANLEVVEVLPPDRKRHEEYKQSLERVKNATSAKDFVQPLGDRVTVDIQWWLERIIEEIKKKGKYNLGTRKQTDILVYENLNYFKVLGDMNKAIEQLGKIFESQGWRSGSIIMNSRYAVVIFCSASAPEFLQVLNRQGMKTAENTFDVWK